MKRKFNIFIFEDFIKQIKNGKNVSESCYILNYNRSRMHDTMTETQKIELRNERKIQYKKYFIPYAQIKEDMKYLLIQNDDFLKSGLIKNTNENLRALKLLRFKYKQDGDNIKVFTQIRS